MATSRTARRPRQIDQRAGNPRISPRMIQARLAEVGRIRLGERRFRGPEDTKGYPAKLNTLRFTSPSQPLLERVAALYGGDVEPYIPLGGGAAQWAVTTPISRVPVIIPPRPYSQYMETWSRGGCLRRCTGETELKTGKPCLCLAEDRQSCDPYTRMSLMLRDVPGLGVWRLESHGWNAAAELPDMLEFLARAGRYVSAELYLKPWRQLVDGETRDFIVPGLQIEDLTPGQLANGTALPAGTAPTALTGARAALPAPAPVTTPSEAADQDSTGLEQLLDVLQRADSQREVLQLRDRALATTTRDDVGDGERIDAACRKRLEQIKVEADQLRGQIVQAWPGETTAEITDAFTSFAGTGPVEASLSQLQQFLKAVLAGQIAPADVA